MVTSHNWPGLTSVLLLIPGLELGHGGGDKSTLPHWQASLGVL